MPTSPEAPESQPQFTLSASEVSTWEPDIMLIHSVTRGYAKDFAQSYFSQSPVSKKIEPLKGLLTPLSRTQQRNIYFPLVMSAASQLALSPIPALDEIQNNYSSSEQISRDHREVRNFVLSHFNRVARLEEQYEAFYLFDTQEEDDKASIKPVTKHLDEAFMNIVDLVSKKDRVISESGGVKVYSRKWGIDESVRYDLLVTMSLMNKVVNQAQSVMGLAIPGIISSLEVFSSNLEALFRSEELPLTTEGIPEISS